MSSIFFLSLMNGSSWGGSEELWYRTALYAARRGRKVACALYYWPGKEDRARELERAGCTIYWLPNGGRSKKNLWEKLQYKLTRLKIRQSMNRLPFREYDMTVINQGGFEVYTSLWKYFYRRLDRYALLFHNYHETETFRSSKIQALREWTENAAVNLFATQRIPYILEKATASTIPHSQILINPITFSPPDTVTEYPPVERKPLVLLMMAALDTDRKAQDHLVQALSSLRWKKRDFKLYLYGEGKNRELLEKLIRQYELSDKVFLKGHTSDVKQVLKSAHLVLQITHRDAMPISVVEAMAMARPVVVSRIGDMPEWVRENQNGWISPDASVESIDNTLEKAWNQKDHWESMGSKSFEIFKEKFPPSPEEYFLSQLGA